RSSDFHPENGRCKSRGEALRSRESARKPSPFLNPEPMMTSASHSAGPRESGRPSTVLYLGCPPAARVDIERQLAAVRLAVVWVDSSLQAGAELQRRDLPVFADFARGAAVLEPLRELRVKYPSMLLVGIVDAGRPDLATEAVLAAAADVVTVPFDARRLVHILDRERAYAAGERPAEA